MTRLILKEVLDFFFNNILLKNQKELYAIKRTGIIPSAIVIYY